MLIPLGRAPFSCLLLLLVCDGANAAGARPNAAPSNHQNAPLTKGGGVFEERLMAAQSMLESGLYAGAERAAREAIDLRRTSRRARYLLGLSLSMRYRNLDEAAENLIVASEEFPEAHLELSRIYIQKADFQRAMQELDQFTRKTKLESRQFLAK